MPPPDRTIVTRNQAEALAALVHQIRPEWQPPTIMAALGDAYRRGGVTLTDLTIAAVKVADNPKKLTPGIIALDGAHWHEQAPHPPTPPTPPRKCPTCHGYHTEADRCLGPPPTGRTDNPQTIGPDGLVAILNVDPTDTIARRGIALCRAALADAKTRHCPHGVDWRNCHQHNGHVVAGEVIKETE